MTMNDELRKLTGERTDAVSLYEAARRTGFKGMREDALRKIELGLTDENEVFRVLH